MQVFADRLLDFTERYADKIARRWWEAVKISDRTPSYRTLSEDKYIAESVSICKEMKRMYHAEKTYDEEIAYFTRYAKMVKTDKVPLHEAIYALVMLRRQMWLFALSQELFTGSLALVQALESINRIVLLFDYATYIVTQVYGK